MAKFVDLHLHTIFSDGTYTPSGLVLEAERKGLSAIAVVDHDTVAAIRPVKEIAKEKNIEVIPGIELSAEYESCEIHVLGYLIDYENNGLLARLEALKKNRVERVYRIVDKLNELGIALEAKDVFDIAKDGTVGRLHIARALLKQAKVGSIFEAFQKYIGEKAPAFYLGFKFSVKEAIKLISDSGGIPVLAHPYVVKNDQFVLKFIDWGLKGIEAYYPEHSQSMVNFYLGLARKYNLLVTGGSDCHGSAKPEVKIGSIKVPYEVVERLKEAKADIEKSGYQDLDIRGLGGSG